MNHDQVPCTQLPPETTCCACHEQSGSTCLCYEINQPRHRVVFTFIEMATAENQLAGAPVHRSLEQLSRMTRHRCLVHPGNLFERNRPGDVEDGGDAGQSASGDDGEAHEGFRSLRRLTITMASSSLSR